MASTFRTHSSQSIKYRINSCECHPVVFVRIGIKGVSNGIKAQVHLRYPNGTTIDRSQYPVSKFRRLRHKCTNHSIKAGFFWGGGNSRQPVSV